MQTIEYLDILLLHFFDEVASCVPFAKSII